MNHAPKLNANYASMRFWQLGFWGFLCVVNFFTLTLWYSEVNFAYTVPVFVQSVLGIVFSIILQQAITRFWGLQWLKKSILNILAIAAVSLVWTLARMYVFEFATNEGHIWNEFGGWYFSSIFIFISWTGLFYGIQYYHLMQEKDKDRRDAQLAARQAEYNKMQAQTIAREAQLEMLRYQLNPHFLCNTLNAINALIQMQETEKAQKMNVNLSDFLRYSLDKISDGKTTLAREVETLSLYLDIEKTRFEDRLRIAYDIEDEALKALVPSLILQPLIENSMKHAISVCEEGGIIKISAQLIGDRLALSVEDSGAGMDKNTETKNDALHHGVGMQNTEQRLKILYNERHTLSISSSSLGGRKTLITLPLEFVVEEPTNT